jgi:hypothetical protein
MFVPFSKRVSQVKLLSLVFYKIHTFTMFVPFSKRVFKASDNGLTWDTLLENGTNIVKVCILYKPVITA